MPTVQVDLRGAPWELLQRLSGAPPYPREVLFDGPASTGKSMGVSHLLYWIAHAFDGCRLLAVRKTRASLTESFCVTWEKTIPRGDECLDGPSKEHRHSYKWSNGSELVLGGLDQPTRLYSTEWDVVFVEEAGELTEDEWVRFLRAIRNAKTPFQVILGATNPYHPTHWLNKRGNSQHVLRLYSRHEDNPAMHDGEKWTPYGLGVIASLDALPGVLKERLRYGRWVAAEGLVWPQYDPAVHDITAKLEEKGGDWWLHVQGWKDPVSIRWFFASVDWGTTAPGSLSVWGVDADKRAFRVVQIYRTGQLIDWWAERAAELHKEFRMRAFVCDPARPDAILKFNDRLGSRGGRDAPRIAIEAKNKRASSGAGDLGGLDQVRWCLKEQRVYFVRDSLRHGPDPDRVARSLPTCTEEEIPAYVLLKAAPGNEADPKLLNDERTDPTCEDHGCDEFRYAMEYLWSHDFKPDPKPETFKPGTYGHTFGTPRSLALEELRQQSDG